MSVYNKLKSLNIELPSLPIPMAAYVSFVKTGNLVFISGHVARKDGQIWKGQFGKDITVEEGKQAAKSIAIDFLSTLQSACEGNLNKVKKIVKVMALINSTSDFTEQPLVANGFSELLIEVFGETIGKHARTAYGVSQLPSGTCAEIEAIVELN